MSGSETDFGPSGGPCAVCGAYRWNHDIQSMHHDWFGLIWKLFHSKKTRDFIRKDFDTWVMDELEAGRLYYKWLNSEKKYLARWPR